MVYDTEFDDCLISFALIGGAEYSNLPTEHNCKCFKEGYCLLP